MDDLSGLDLLQFLIHFRHGRGDCRVCVAPGVKDDHTEIEHPQILLVFEVSIHSDEGIEFHLRQPEKLAVLFAIPFASANCRNLAPFIEEAR
ncbi:MAG: hypothetical protein M3494_12565 [Actinomycetota bacterium]|nr:hypothetical protein [Rubrobacter sp.]MDQ3508828.1 hypothetical protein [Actinomycetota bacterium]